jgi:hypothetical protein
VLGSNLGQSNDYREIPLWFSSVTQGKSRGNALKVRHDRFLSCPYQFIIHWGHLIIRRYVGLSELMTASLNVP